MFDLKILERELVQSRPYVAAFSPGWSAAFVQTHWLGVAIKHYGRSKPIVRGLWKILIKHEPAAPIAGQFIAQKTIIKRTAIFPAKQVLKAHVRVGGTISSPIRQAARTWINEPGRYKMVIVYHDADRAGPHLDVHIGQLSLIYRVKPDLYSQLKYNRDGYLTATSQTKLMDHIRSEILNGSRVPQNADHDPSQAEYGWVKREKTELGGYGAGLTRQVISESEVDVFKAYDDGPIEFYAPALNAHRRIYLYGLYPGDGKKAPICIMGAKKNQPPNLEDRLHLKMIHPQDIEKLDVKADMSTSTAKYDGSSCYFVITPKGTQVWSPRQSVRTQEQIEYTMKLNGVAMVTNHDTIVGMGEIMFRDAKGNYLPQAQGSGILNSNIVLPKGITPEIRMYRIDKVGRAKTVDLPFWENRKLQDDVSKLDPEHFKLVELMSPQQAKQAGYEGVVVAPAKILNEKELDDVITKVENYESEDWVINETDSGQYYTAGPLIEGYKVKWWTDPNDWRIDKVAFEPGEKGGIAGVVYCTSLESGKPFKLGPGQVGNRELTEHMMGFPERYEGAVLKVNSRHGHEGRAAKAVAFHPDKGLAPF